MSGFYEDNFKRAEAMIMDLSIELASYKADAMRYRRMKTDSSIQHMIYARLENDKIDDYIDDVIKLEINT